MKKSFKQFALVSPTLAGGAWLALVLLAGSASAATNFIYDIYQEAPGTLPQNPPWTEVTTYVNGSDSRTASGRLLTLVDGPEQTDPGYYYTAGINSGDISLNSEYEARARVRLRSYGDTLGGDRALYTQVIEDGNRFIGIGMTLTNGLINVFLMNCCGGSLSTVYSAPAPIGDDFYNVMARKVGTTGTSADFVDLFVDGILVPGPYPGHTQNYGNMPMLFGAPNGAKEVYWGTASSAGFGTVELTGVSFGIDQAAPALLPEPSAIGLSLFGLLLALKAWNQRRACG